MAKEEKYDMPSRFGSHKSMVDEAETEKIKPGEGKIVCKDEHGFYVTDKNRLDDGLADPNRVGNWQRLARAFPTLDPKKRSRVTLEEVS